MRFLFAALCIARVSAQPTRAPTFSPTVGTLVDGCGTSCVSSSACTGSDYYVCKVLAYSTSTGKFTGTIKTNGCPNYSGYNAQSGTCSTYNIPASGLTMPGAVAFGGAVGFTLNGMNMYGSIEMGITCTDKTLGTGGTCAKGTSVYNCVQEMIKYCPNNNLYKSTDTEGFMGSQGDTCGWHANPSHLHYSPAAVCATPNYSSGHSPLVAISKDGYGIYGLYETTNTAPTDLDACNGHYGPITTDAGFGGALSGISGFSAANTSVYHYHTSSSYPYTIGCYGPATYSACTKLTQDSGAYDNSVMCNNYVPLYTSSGGLVYTDDYCQCRPTAPGGPGKSLFTQSEMASLSSSSVGAKCWPWYGGWSASIANSCSRVTTMYPATSTATPLYTAAKCLTSYTPTAYTSCSTKADKSDADAVVAAPPAAPAGGPAAAPSNVNGAAQLAASLALVLTAFVAAAVSVSY